MESKTRLKPKDALTDLYLLYGIEDDVRTDSIKSVFGEIIDLTEGNHWKDRIEIFIPGYGRRVIRGLSEINSHPVIDHSLRSFLFQFIKSNASFKNLQLLINAAKKINIDRTNEENATEQIHDWIQRTINETEIKQSELLTVLRQYIEFCIDESYWAFDDFLIWSLPRTNHEKSKSLHRISLLDPIYGPFTQSEIMQISIAIDSATDISISEKSLIMLCRDLGLRPIQIALLRADDLLMDRTGPKIKIPRVKGCATGLRRNEKNFIERDISPTLHHALTQTIKENQPIIEQHKRELKEYSATENIPFYEPPEPLFCKKVIGHTTFQIYKNEGIREYCLHLRSGEISICVKKSGDKLKIKSSRTEELNFIPISPYRFRRSMATNMVLQGYSPEEVAYSLDHLSLMSIRHYFKFNTEVVDFVNSVVQNSFEISQMIDYWSGKFINKNELSNNSKMRKVGTIGLCSKNEVCHANPSVTCYSCSNFRPYADGAHQEALEQIIRVKDEISKSSSGPVKNQMELSYQMAKQCVIAQERILQNENK